MVVGWTCEKHHVSNPSHAVVKKILIYCVPTRRIFPAWSGLVNVGHGVTPVDWTTKLEKIQKHKDHFSIWKKITKNERPIFG